MKSRVTNYKDDMKGIIDNTELILNEIKEMKQLMIKLWRAEDVEENNGEFRWPFDKHGNLLDNVNLTERLNGSKK
jgi:hypothetical protein|tara:strand:+ start:91 stop:315 length:225 start_codon:yes stop_codon:yes gene_type:complete